jgi:hypothetical protein
MKSNNGLIHTHTHTHTHTQETPLSKINFDVDVFV